MWLKHNLPKGLDVTLQYTVAPWVVFGFVCVGIQANLNHHEHLTDVHINYIVIHNLQSQSLF